MNFNALVEQPAIAQRDWQHSVAMHYRSTLQEMQDNRAVEEDYVPKKRIIAECFSTKVRDFLAANVGIDFDAAVSRIMEATGEANVTKVKRYVRAIQLGH